VLRALARSPASAGLTNYTNAPKHEKVFIEQEKSKLFAARGRRVLRALVRSPAQQD